MKALQLRMRNRLRKCNAPELLLGAFHYKIETALSRRFKKEVEQLSLKFEQSETETSELHSAIATLHAELRATQEEAEEAVATAELTKVRMVMDFFPKSVHGERII